MSRRAGRDLYARQLLVDDRADRRYADLALEIVDESGATLLDVGGRWDRKTKGWAGDARHEKITCKIHEGQREAMQWLAGWFSRYLAADDSEPVYSALLLGGSRSGKTWLALRCAVAFAIAVPGSRVWLICETESAFDELQAELEQLLPGGAFTVAFEVYRCVNGSTLTLRSGMHPHKLKRGRCDFAIVNEGQNVDHMVHDLVRMRCADTGGLLLVAANPPNDDPAGQWIADYAEDCRAGRRPNARCFRLDPRANPHVDQEQLHSLAAETDDRTYRIEVLGEVLAPSNAVMHAFSSVENVRPRPELPGSDVTAAFLERRGLGRASHFVGLDFQRTPYMAAAIGQAHRNPRDETTPYLWYVDEVCADLGDEHDLSQGLYALGLDPSDTVLIGDASGDWQDADRKKGSSSFDLLRSLGWRRIHRPDTKLRVNPAVHERLKNDNRLFAAADGTHVVMVDPKCERLIEACKEWRRKYGLPDKRSRFAHIAEAMSYSNWRLYPRQQSSGAVGYERISGRSRPGQMRSW